MTICRKIRVNAHCHQMFLKISFVTEQKESSNSTALALPRLYASVRLVDSFLLLFFPPPLFLSFLFALPLPVAISTEKQKYYLTKCNSEKEIQTQKSKILKTELKKFFHLFLFFSFSCSTTTLMSSHFFVTLLLHHFGLNNHWIDIFFQLGIGCSLSTFKRRKEQVAADYHSQQLTSLCHNPSSFSVLWFDNFNRNFYHQTLQETRTRHQPANYTVSGILSFPSQNLILPSPLPSQLSSLSLFLQEKYLSVFKQKLTSVHKLFISFSCERSITVQNNLFHTPSSPLPCDSLHNNSTFSPFEIVDLNPASNKDLRNYLEKMFTLLGERYLTQPAFLLVLVDVNIWHRIHKNFTSDLTFFPFQMQRTVFLLPVWHTDKHVAMTLWSSYFFSLFLPLIQQLFPNEKSFPASPKLPQVIHLFNLLTCTFSTHSQHFKSQFAAWRKFPKVQALFQLFDVILPWVIHFFLFFVYYHPREMLESRCQSY